MLSKYESSSKPFFEHCTEKSYYFQFDGEHGAAEIHRGVDGSMFMNVYPGQSWNLKVPMVSRGLRSLWDETASISKWDTCWPQWWKVSHVTPANQGWDSGCQFATKHKIWNLVPTPMEDGAQAENLTESETPKEIDLTTVQNIRKGKTVDVLSINYIDADGASQTLTLTEGTYYPERILKVLFREASSEDHSAWKHHLEGNGYLSGDVPKPEVGKDNLESVGTKRYFQGAETWLENGFRALAGTEGGVFSFISGITGGLLGLTIRSPLAAWQKMKDDRELKHSATSKIWEKLTNCNTLFKKCGDFELVPKHASCTADM